MEGVKKGGEDVHSKKLRRGHLISLVGQFKKPESSFRRLEIIVIIATSLNG